jgi:hypothetical protein
LVRLESAIEDEVAPLTSAQVEPALSLFCHWYVSEPPRVTLAVTENVAEPLDAVWFVGCAEMVIVGTGGV